MSHSDLLHDALTYASYGWAIFPAHSMREDRCTCGRADCASPGKHPLTKHGFKDASTDPRVIQAWWKKFPWANIAIATGEASGRLLVVDIDNRQENGFLGDENWEAITQGHQDTLEVLTGSGGRHLYFRYPADVRIKSGVASLGAGLDVRADGGYVLAPPSLHRTGRRYEWEAASDPAEGAVIADAPDWLLELCQQQRTTSVSSHSQLLPLDKVQEIRSALVFIPSDDYQTWLQVGMALHSTLAGEQAYGLWTEWSMQSSKYDPRSQRSAWQSMKQYGGVTLSTVFWMAKQNGWVESPPLVTAKNVPVHKMIPETDPTGLTEPPGILGDITRFMLETAMRPQPEFAVNAALTLAAVVLGRKYVHMSGLRTNLYLITIGSTGMGKDHPRKVIKNILTAANLEHLHGGETIASGQGLLARVKRTPNVLFQLDEFGLLLKTVMAKNAMRHNREIMINIIRLFSSADTVFFGTEYADQAARPTVSLEYPCVTINATTTQDTFYESLESKNVVDGFLNRFLVIDMSHHPRPPLERDKPLQEIPENILEWVSLAINPENKRHNLERVSPPSLPASVLVTESPEAKGLLEEFRLDVEEKADATLNTGVDALWSRALEHAVKIAMICACADNIEEPVIQYDHALWATRFVAYHTELLARQVKERIADTDFERMVNDFHLAISLAGEQGLTEREMNRRKPFRSFPQKDRKAAMETLLHGGQVALCEIGTKGRKRFAYVAVEDQGDES